LSLTALIISFSLLVIAMTVHEFAHGWTAFKLGDKTAKYSGRLTLNPLAHIDLVWTILIPFMLFLGSKGQFVFGAAKPVPVNYTELKNPKRDMIWIALSGPLSNIIFAVFISLLIRFIPQNTLLLTLLVNLAVMNVVLGVFNLIPIPPLDGSKIILGILPASLARKYALLEQYSFIILIALVWSGVIGNMLWPAVEFILRALGVA
jgi:Zn-dependent protease